ncbi:DUF2637 domain-containing protein [Nocardia cyriacigeorgica]|uniref:DUF2637 domain-containing protein n=1 Tax=Nocardia cyriacigeorgica TaxID=135487 RepID=UPI0034D67521
MTALIVAGAFWLSFTALRSLAVAAGAPGREAWLWPLTSKARWLSPQSPCSHSPSPQPLRPDRPTTPSRNPTKFRVACMRACPAPGTRRRMSRCSNTCARRSIHLLRSWRTSQSWQSCCAHAILAGAVTRMWSRTR